jgi:hypothetical protein
MRKELCQKRWHLLFSGQSMTKIKQSFADWKSYVAEAISHHMLLIRFAG